MERKNFLFIIIFAFVLGLHIFLFLLLVSARLSIFGSDQIAGSAFSSMEKQIDVYYERFGDKKFKIILTKLSDIKTDFINKIEEKEKKIEKEIIKTKKEIIKPIVKKKEKPKFNNVKLNADNNKSKKVSDKVTESLGEGSRIGSGIDGGGEGSGGTSAASEKGGHLKNPQPPYPRISQENGEEGDVGIETVVEPNGKPSFVKIYKSSGFKRLDNSALVTVREKYTFIPAKRLGVPVRSTYRFNIKFRIND